MPVAVSPARTADGPHKATAVVAATAAPMTRRHVDFIVLTSMNGERYVCHSTLWRHQITGSFLYCRLH
jgi:hypothetical protein